MKINLTEGDYGFHVHFQAETVSEASQLARMALNVKDVDTGFYKDSVMAWISFPVNKNRRRSTIRK